MWETLRGIIFLSPDLYPRVPAITQVPVPNNHPALHACRSILNNLRETWLEGTFSGLWNKWNKKTLRTTNIAETFHSNLLSEVRKKRAPLYTLLRVLKRKSVHAKAKLLHHQRNIWERPTFYVAVRWTTRWYNLIGAVKGNCWRPDL